MRWFFPAFFSFFFFSFLIFDESLVRPLGLRVGELHRKDYLPEQINPNKSLFNRKKQNTHLTNNSEKQKWEIKHGPLGA